MSPPGGTNWVLDFLVSHKTAAFIGANYGEGSFLHPNSIAKNLIWTTT